MDRVRLCRDEFLKCIYGEKRRFIDTLDACVHPLIQFCRHVHKACVVVSYHVGLYGIRSQVSDCITLICVTLL